MHPDESLTNVSFDERNDANMTDQILLDPRVNEDEFEPLDSPVVKAVLILLYSIVFFTCVIGKLMIVLALDKIDNC
jgi:hypothetical protein